MTDKPIRVGEKYSAFFLTQIIGVFIAVPSHRGAARDRHGRGAGCGGRFGCWALSWTMQGGLRSVSGPGKTPTTMLRAYGEVAWSWRPLLASRGEPVAKSERPETVDPTVTTTKSSPGRARYKPLDHCAGKAGLLPLNLYAHVRFLPSASWHMRPRVQRAPGLPCALSFLGRNDLQNSDATCRENEKSRS